MMEDKKAIIPMEHFNMSDFLRGQASRIITSISDEDKTGESVDEKELSGWNNRIHDPYTRGIPRRG